MDLPIKLKYLSIHEGQTQVHKADDAEVPGYILCDGIGKVVASGTSLANLFEYALQVDISYELMHQYITRGHLDTCKHLEDVDCDDTGQSAIAVPGGMRGPGGQLLN